MGDRGPDRGRPRQAAPVAPRQWPGALRGDRRGRLRRRQRALRPGRGDAHLPAHGRRDPGRSRARRRHAGPGRGARRRAGGHAGRHRAVSRSTARRCRCATTSCSTPRSPPATSTVATTRTSCSRRSRRRRRRSARRCAARSSSATGVSSSRWAPRRCPTRCAARLRDGSIRRVVVIGQGTAAIAGQSLAAVLTSLADDALRAEAVVATEFSGFQLRDDMTDTLVIAISQSGTTTDTNRTSDLARARGARRRRDRQPAQQRPGRQVRRRALHVRRSRRGDGGAVDQGVLRADRRRLPARDRDRRRGGRARPARGARDPRRAARAARRDDDGAHAAERDRRHRAAARAVRAGTGPSSATGATASPPPRCG